MNRFFSRPHEQSPERIQLGALACPPTRIISRSELKTNITWGLAFPQAFRSNSLQLSTVRREAETGAFLTLGALSLSQADIVACPSSYNSVRCI